MGNSSSQVIDTELLVERSKAIRSSLSDRDRRLFNHAKFAIAQEKETCDNCELFIDFQDQDGLTIQTNSNPTGRIFVGYDGNDKLIYVWEKRGLWNTTSSFFVDNFERLLGVLNSAFGAATVTLLAIRAIRN